MKEKKRKLMFIDRFHDPCFSSTLWNYFPSYCMLFWFYCRHLLPIIIMFNLFHQLSGKFHVAFFSFSMTHLDFAFLRFFSSRFLTLLSSFYFPFILPFYSTHMSLSSFYLLIPKLVCHFLSIVHSVQSRKSCHYRLRYSVAVSSVFL